MAFKLTSYSAFLNKACALIGIPYDGMTVQEQTFLETYFNNQMGNIWSDSNWMDVCPYGEARFAGDLLTYPNDLTKSAYWSLTNYTATANAIANPADGKVSATKVLETSATNVTHSVVQNYTFIPNVSYQYSAYLRPINRNSISLEIYDGANTYTAFFDIQAGTVTSQTNNFAFSPSIVQQNNGFWLCTVYITSAATAGAGHVSTGSSVSYNGDPTKGFYSWGQVLLQTSFADPSLINIPYAQIGENEIDVVFQVWRDSPIGALNPRPQGYTLNPDNIQIIGPFGYATYGIYYSAFPNGYAPSQFPVYLYYRKEMPDYSGNDYDATLAYAVDDQILFTDSKSVMNFWKCNTVTTAGQSPDTNPEKWDLLEIPAMFLMFAVYGAFADWLRMDGQLDKASAMDAIAQSYQDQEADKAERQEGWVMPIKISTHVTSQPRIW